MSGRGNGVRKMHQDARSGSSGRGKRTKIVQGGIVAADAVRGIQSEKSWQAEVETLAAMCGWITLVLPSYVLRCEEGHPVHWGRSVLKGWPDLALFRPPRKIAWEVKAEDGVVTVEQERMLEWLADCGFETGVIRPSALDYVLQELT